MPIRKTPSRRRATPKQKNVSREHKQTLTEMMRLRDPEKSKLFKELKYTELRKKGIGIPFLRRVGFDIPMMMHIGVPATEIVQAVPLKRVVEVIKNPNVDHIVEVQLLKALRKKKVSVRTLNNLHVQLGILYALGGYSRKEMLEGGIPQQKVDFIIGNIKKSQARFRK